MGNANARLFNVCRSLKKSKNGSSENGDDDSTLTDSAIVLRNRDKYFIKDDYDKIMEKFPQFKEWIDESINPQAKDRPKQKKIRFREAEVIGLGSYGRVIMGLNVENGCLMATKQVQLGTGNNPPAQQERIKSLRMEIELLSRFSHKNIVRYYGAQKNKNTFNIFLEYVSGGTIASLLDKYGPFNENLIRVYVRQILEGLEYLHVRNTIHRDIKGANILVDNNGICKLADFGTATKISGLLETDAKNNIASLKGTVRWMAPEVIKQNNLGRFCDIWSVGCTVIEMATAQPPWHNVIKANSNSISTLYQIAQAKTAPPFPKGLSPEAIDFLKQCFKINPQERANVIKLLQHKFVSGVESPYNSFLKDSNPQQANSKPTSKTIQTKFVAQTDINPNQNPKAVYTEVTPKVFSRLQSLASPTLKSPALKTTQETTPKDKMVELEKDKKHQESFSIKSKDQDVETEVQSGFPSKKVSTEDKLSNSVTSVKSQKGKIPKGKKYIVQTDGPESKNEKTGNDTNDAKDNGKSGAVLLDLRENTKITIVARPLGQSPKTSTYGKEYSRAKKNRLSEINCFLEGESEDSKNQSEEDSAPGDTKAVKHHSNSREIIPQAEEENEGVNSKHEEKKDMKRSQEKKKQHQMKISIPKKNDNEEDSDSSDSDRDPSMANSSVFKPSGHANAVDHGSFSTHGIEGKNMNINVHDQSSRFSIRRDGSFDAKRDHPEVNSERKVRATRAQSEIIKPEMMNMSGKKAGEKQVDLASSLNKKDDKGNKSHRNFSLMNPENEGKKLKKKAEKEKITKKGTCDNEYLQNFNLLDDLNKVYGQLEATSPPIK